MEPYLPMIKEAFNMFLFLGVELSILFILISAIVNFIQQYIPEEKIQEVLSETKPRSYFFAAILGGVTPFCSCSTIPMLKGLLKAKAGFGPILTFLFTSPLLNPIIVALCFATFGAKVTYVYIFVALIVSIIASVILSKLGFARYIISQSSFATSKSYCPTTTAPIQVLAWSSVANSVVSNNNGTSSSCCSTSKKVEEFVNCCGSSKKIEDDNSSKVKIKKAFKEAWKQFLEVLPYLLVGIVLGALIYGFVPSDLIVKYTSDNSIWAVPISAVIGIPLYVRVEALIPLSAALVEKGMGLGPVLALIIGGGGASITEVILLKSMFKTPMIVAFLVVILSMAILAGYLLQYIL